MLRIVKKCALLVLTLMVTMTILPTSVFAAEDTTTETVVTEIDNTEVGAGVNQFAFSGAWVADANGAAHQGTEHWSNKGKWGENPPSVTIRFKGNKIELFGQKENTGAIYSAVLDGDEENAIKIDTYNLSKQPKERLYIKEGLSEEEHTLTLTVLKEINVLGGSYGEVNVSSVIDYALVTSVETVSEDKTYETKIDNVDVTNSDELFKYTFDGPGWVQGTGSSLFYKGTEAYANNADANMATYSIKFIGSGVKIIASKNPGHADYEVFIDNIKVGDAPAKLESGSSQHNQVLFEKYDIDYGEHTLKVAAKAGSSGAIQADAVVITHKRIDPTAISMDKEALSIEAGLSKKVTASITPSYANGSIEYFIQDTSIATITETGEVTALKAGSTAITASVKGTNVSTSIPLTITPEGLPLAISVGDANMLVTQDHFDKVLTQAQTSWTDVAWRGDVLYSKIDLASKKEVNNVTVTASDFTSGSNKISAGNVEINWLRETLANIGRGNGGAPVKPFPDIIGQSANTPLDIDGKRVQSAWININVPEDAKPGIYSGKISISSDELVEDSVLSYTFEVLDLVQPKPREMDTQVQIWQHPFSVANYYGVSEADYFEEEHLKYMRESMKEYASLGGKDVVANIVNEAWGHQSYYGDPTMVTWIKKEDGSMAFDYDWFDKWIEFNIQSGVLDPEKGIGQIKCFSIVPWDDSFTYFDQAKGETVKVAANAGSEFWISMWTSFLTDFMSHVEEKGWFNITYISLDERPMNRVGPAVDLIKSIVNDEGVPFKISSAFNYQSGNDYSFLDKIDDISIGLSHVNDNTDDMQKMAEHRNELGLLTTIYTCTGDYPGNFTISDPVDNAWGMWYTMKQNTNGYMKWAWDNWVEDPLTDVTYKYWEPGDGWFIYPTEKGVESDTYFYKTPRYEMLKQGTRDINKAKYIMENSTTLSADVDALVKSLKRPAAGGNGYGSAVPKSEADRQLAGSEVTRMREGINEIAIKYIEENKPEEIPVTSIEVDKKDITLVEGENVNVIANVLPANATNQSLIWSSDNDAVASVANGKITGLKAGTATILIESADGKVNATINVTVTKKVEIPEESLKDIIVESANKEASVSGTLPGNVIFVVTEVVNDMKEELMKRILANNPEYMKDKVIEKIMDLQLMMNNVTYLPNGDMKVSLKVSKELLKKQLRILYVKEDGTIEEIASKVENGYITFTTSHFSYYAIVSIRDASTINKAEDAIKATGTSSSVGSGWMILGCGILIGLCLKKKEDKLTS